MLIVIVGLILGFHVVSYPGGITFIPKKNLSFAYSFTSTESLIDDYNAESLLERLQNNELNSLIGELKKRELIVTSSEMQSFNNKFSLKQFYQINEGMTYDAVVNLLGADGETMSSNDIGGYKNEMFTWKNDDGSSIMLMFQNGRLVSKTQYGLK